VNYYFTGLNLKSALLVSNYAELAPYNYTKEWRYGYFSYPMIMDAEKCFMDK